LSTSDIKANKEKATKVAFTYFLISLFWALFGGIYEIFSHEVYSFYMIYAFAIPLVMGTLPFWIYGMSGRDSKDLEDESGSGHKYPNSVTLNLYHAAIATLTIGSIMKGVLDIYGTTNSLIKIYPSVGAVLLAMAAIGYLSQKSDD